MNEELELSFEKWPNQGRMGLCRRSSDQYRGNEEGRIALVVVDQVIGLGEPPYWEVYMDIKDNFPSSIRFGAQDFATWLEAVQFEWIPLGEEEVMLERSHFGLRDYWDRRSRKAESRSLKKWFRARLNGGS